MSAESEFVPFDVKLQNQRIERAEAHAMALERERDKAVAELVKLKRDISWTMDFLRINDLIFNSDPIPAAGSAYQETPLRDSSRDCERIVWINAHGRVSLGEQCFVIGLPHGGAPGDETIPTPYNIRDIIDICRKRVMPKSDKTTN